MIHGASWYGHRPLTPHVDRVYTACGYGNKGLGRRDMGGGGSSVGVGRGMSRDVETRSEVGE